MSIAPGTEILGKYRILEHGSRTPWLEIYNAEHIILGRSVRVALLREEVAAKPGVATRLLDLGRVLASVRHNELLDIYESIEIPGRIGLVTEVPPDNGVTRLAEAMATRPGKWSPGSIRDWMVPALRALQILHDEGLVHGAIAPRSFVKTSKATRIVDLVHIRLEVPRLTSMRPPSLDDVRGIAPEWFADSSDVGLSADIYSMGAILYELATGRPPFDDSDPRVVMTAHLGQRPTSPRELNSEVPDGMERIIMRALSKHPLYRFESAATMANALADYLHFKQPIPVGAAPWERTHEDEPDGPPDQAADESPDESPVPIPINIPDHDDLDPENTLEDVIDEKPAELVTLASVPPARQTSGDQDTDPMLPRVPASSVEEASEPAEVSEASENIEVSEDSDDSEGEPSTDGPPGADGTVLRSTWNEQVVVFPKIDEPDVEEEPVSVAPEEPHSEPDPPVLIDDPAVTTGRVRIGEADTDAASARWVAIPILLIGAAIVVAWVLLRPSLGDDATVEIERNHGDIETLIGAEPDPTMVLIPSGPAVLGGRPHPDLWEANQMPARVANVPAFAIDKTEVTNAAFRRCIQAGACKGDVPMGEASTLPVTGISWNDAESYCRFEGKRLPTEMEWEVAARGRTGAFFPWGDGNQCERANVQSDDCQSTEGKEPAGSRVAGQSPYGVLQMGGNVWEWTADDYLEPEWLARKLDGEFTSQSRGKVIKGGDWMSSPRAIGWRAWNSPSVREENGGFRCASSLLDARPQPLALFDGAAPSPNGRLSSLLMGAHHTPTLARPPLPTQEKRAIP